MRNLIVSERHHDHSRIGDVTDLRGALARGLAAGGTMDAGWDVQETPGGLTVALRDPDGNSIELFERR